MICSHCGAATGRLAEAQERLIEAALRYALATMPNGHPVDAAFREAVGEFTRCGDDHFRDDLGQPRVSEPH